MKTILLLFTFITMNIFAQGNFNVEWESPVWGYGFTSITQFETNNTIPDIVTGDGASLKVYDGATKSLKHSYSNPDTSGFNNFFEQQFNRIDINNDGICEFALENNEWSGSWFNWSYKILDGATGSILNQNSYNNMIGSIYAIDIDGDSFIELCITLSGQEYNQHKLIILSTTAHPIGLNEIGTKATDYNLKQNYPNPFNPSTTIEYSITKDAYVQVLIFNEIGQLVNILTEGSKKAGSYKVQFDGTEISSGVYFYQISVDDRLETKKMVLVK